jgi:O-antigen/teichoic acid export membrane protein
VASGASLLTLATVASGVLTYGFLILAARSLGTAAYGQVGVLWAAMFLVAIVAFRPLEQTTSQAIAQRVAAGTEVRSVVRTMTVVALSAAAALSVAFALAWQPIADRLFHSDQVLMAALVVGVLSYGLSYLVRGVLGGLRWFGGYAVVLLADGGFRMMIALPLFLVSSHAVAAAAVAAAGIGGAVAPIVLGRRRLRAGLRGGEPGAFGVRNAATFAAPATVIAGADQLLVNGAPLLVAVSGGSSSAVGLVFAATMLVRAPVYVFQGFAASLLPNLTHLAEVRGRADLRRAVARTAGVLFASGVAFTAVAAAGGPAAMRTVYGASFAAPAMSLALLAAGVACYLAAGTFSQALLALELGVTGAVCWSVACVTFVGSYAILPGSPLIRASAGLAIGSLVAAVTLGFSLARRSR